MKHIRLFEEYSGEHYNQSLNEMRVQTPTFDNLISVLTELLKEYDDAEVSWQQCTYISGMIRWIFERYSIESKLMSATVTDNTPNRMSWTDTLDEFHNFIVSNGKSIDFTMGQFFYKDLQFPLILDVDSDEFRKIYREVQDDEKRYLDNIKYLYDNKELYWDENNKEYTNDYVEINEMLSYVDKIIEIFG
jgi:hypothetical protein